MWWFHGETETTTQGITADLEAFKRMGVGGVVYYDQSHGKAEHALPGFSAEWWKMLRFSAEEAQRLGLTFEVHLSNGYVAGGPWISYETGMKRLTATETFVKGGGHFTSHLEAPITPSKFYKDVAVLAFPAPLGASENSTNTLCKISSNLPELDAAKIFQPKPASLTKIAPKAGGIWIDIEFPQGLEVRSITYEVAPKGKATSSATNIPGPPRDTFVGTGYRVLPNLGQLEVSEDGKMYKKVCDLKPIYKAHESWRQKTVSFEPVKGKYYRLNLHDWWESEQGNRDLMIGSVVLNSAAKIDQWEEKAGLFSEYIEADKTPDYNAQTSINAKNVINISDKMDAYGLLNWDVPPGNWVVMRFAYIPTGASIKHGRANLMGLECDKLSVKAAEKQWENYTKKIVDSLIASGSGHVMGVAMDSHEAGSQNWTDDFIGQFKTRRGYDPTPFLPAMMGYVVDGVKQSNGFLFDIRRNIADMISDNYYATFERLCNEKGLVFTAQAIGNALCIVGDPIQAKSRVSKPQGEFWAIHPNGNYDIKESSSAAHLYDKKIASAEAFTDTKFSNSVADIKSLADYAFAFGINEFVICASAYQPWLDKIPGSTGGGRHYAINRNNTWWNYSRPFWDYQARNAQVMRAGKSTASICVFLGENAPVKILTYRLPDIPPGFDFDAFTADALLTRMSGKVGKIMLPDGVGYDMMVLPRNGDITFSALKKISAIVKNGGRIYGSKPLRSLSFSDFEKSEGFQKLADDLWGKNPGKTGETHLGKGVVYWGISLADAIKNARIIPDISMKHGDPKSTMIYFTHRKLSDAHIYFLDNHKDSTEDNFFTFAAVGKYAQLWNAVTGKRYVLPIVNSTDRTTTVKIVLAARESCLIVITDRAEILPSIQWPDASDNSIKIEGAWQAYFDEKRGGPGTYIFQTLSDWTKNEDARIKYYSGTAIYKKTIALDTIKDEIDIDLGNPGSIAQVYVNGHDAGIIWCSPWTLPITQYLKIGQNDIEIQVANSLMNRMILDSGLPEKERITYAYPIIANPTEALQPSGLKEVKLIMRNTALRNQ